MCAKLELKLKSSKLNDIESHQYNLKLKEKQMLEIKLIEKPDSDEI